MKAVQAEKHLGESVIREMDDGQHTREYYGKIAQRSAPPPSLGNA